MVKNRSKKMVNEALEFLMSGKFETSLGENGFKANSLKGKIEEAILNGDEYADDDIESFESACYRILDCIAIESLWDDLLVEIEEMKYDRLEQEDIRAQSIMSAITAVNLLNKLCNIYKAEMFWSGNNNYNKEFIAAAEELLNVNKVLV